MSQKDSDSIEAARWKKKFLDTLEVHDSREKSLVNRIRLLRRGLVSVSLAGDGLDTALDRELSSLRATLRTEDSEAGIDLLLERIEKSVLKLDTRKEQSHYAIKTALNSSVKQLQELDLSRELSRGVRQYAKVLAAKIQDPQNHNQLIVDFLELLRMVVRELTFQAAPEEAPASAGFWSRLFGGSSKEESGAEAPVQEVEPVSPQPAMTHVPAEPAALSVAAEGDSANAQTQALTQNEGDTAQAPYTEPEPGFSAIANHAEPVLLRILDNIYVPAQSVPLATKTRGKVSRGLNWYEFVAVLEDIYALITAALEEERSEFQRFLNELNERLGQVQEYVQFSRDQEGAARESERALDEAVRTQISDISETVQVAEDIGELKSAVKTQLSTILMSMDQFKAMKVQQQEHSQEHSRQLEERLKAMESESRELRMHLAQQEQMASQDALTGLPNRAAYNRRIQEETTNWRNALAAGHGEGLCLAVCDVDHFKRVNDGYGHLAGDKVLKIIAKELSSRLRKTDFVARFGGEEFVILMPETTLENAEPLINSIRQKIENCPFHFKEKQVQITVSFGLACFSETDTPDKVFERADKALYRAKEGGRNQVCLAKPASSAASKKTQGTASH